MLTDEELKQLKDICRQAVIPQPWQIRTNLSDDNRIDFATLSEAIAKLVAEVEQLRNTNKNAQRLVDIWRERAKNLEKSGFTMWDNGFYGTLKGEGRFETLLSCADELEEVLNQDNDDSIRE